MRGGRRRKRRSEKGPRDVTPRVAAGRGGRAGPRGGLVRQRGGRAHAGRRHRGGRTPRAQGHPPGGDRRPAPLHERAAAAPRHPRVPRRGPGHGRLRALAERRLARGAGLGRRGDPDALRADGRAPAARAGGPAHRTHRRACGPVPVPADPGPGSAARSARGRGQRVAATSAEPPRPRTSEDAEGPVARSELRGLVDYLERRTGIEPGEREMVRSVFELGDTIAREVMVPRTDMVFIESDKTVEQALSLAMRSGFSRIPVVGENEDNVVGIAYLKDIVAWSHEHPGGRGDREGRHRHAPGQLRAGQQAGRRTAAPDAGAAQSHGDRDRRVRRHCRDWSPSRISWKRSSARSPTSTTTSSRRSPGCPPTRPGSPPGFR